jgi:NAD(P)-dependent dehydrogenase (short-subunit alcohol dehydrogenase family)
VNAYERFNRETFPGIVADELRSHEQYTEIIYSGGERMRHIPRVKAVEESGDSSIGLDENSTVLVLGGAQGITRELVARLAADWPCNYVLVGRSVESEEIIEKYGSLETLDEVRKQIIAEKELTAPREIEAKARNAFKTIQIKNSKKMIEDAGAKASYYTADVRHVDEMKKVIADVKSRHGKIDAVIHAAGTLEDKLFRDKTHESFERTYQTKVNPLRIITNELLPELKLLVLFSSLASTVGNRGQCDYAAGNSVLDMTSMVLNSKSGDGVKVVAFNWGPWKGGMVGSAMEAEFKRRGLSLIKMENGREFFVDDLNHGVESPVLAIAGDSASIESFIKNALEKSVAELLAEVV